MRHLRVLLLFVLTTVPAHSATLRGTAVDAEGAAVKVRVLIRWDPVGLDEVADNTGSAEDRTVTADRTGHFSLELPPGVYDVFVSAPGFFPHCEKLSVGKDEVRPYEVRLRTSRILNIKVD